ncbi:hypothetical protein [Streptomyces sp. NPDC001068]|uniref:hypothetical protein n=1 Tax=Streptomyces sp. NPDC001068 TaxID=3364544 RepID=UPI0036C59343
MTSWLSARSTWVLVLLLWASTLAVALPGIALVRAVLEHPPLRPFTADLPMTIGGTFCCAAAGAGGMRRRHRQQER